MYFIDANGNLYLTRKMRKVEIHKIYIRENGMWRFYLLQPSNSKMLSNWTKISRRQANTIIRYGNVEDYMEAKIV